MATLIVNGDFETGNTGFTSEYTYTPPGPGNLDAENFYTVDTDPRKSSDLDRGGTGLAPQKDLQSAVLETLAPGAYTAIVAGQSDSTGVALVEVYRLP